MKFDKEFWDKCQKLVDESEIIIDRPKGSRHPHFYEAVYPLNYGYLKGTQSMDGEGIDVFLGENGNKDVKGILCTIDTMKRDSEIKILIGLTKEEIQVAYEFLNESKVLKCIFVERK